MNHRESLLFTPEAFRMPDKENNVVYAWFWNSPVTKELIDRQLEEASAAGIGGMYIAPLPKDFRPDTMRTFLDPEYLTPAFFELVRYAVEKGLELGMEIWLYDEGGWPSGGACGHTMRENSETGMDILTSKSVSLHAGEQYRCVDPVLAVFDRKKRLPDVFCAKEDMEITAFYTKNVVDGVNRTDGTNASVTDTFIANTYQKYKDCLGDLFGKKVSMIFTDEPGVFLTIIPKGFFERFRKTYGYDVKDYLYALVDISAAGTREEYQARIDYGKLVGAYFKENFCERLAKWCNRNEILFGGHLDLDHIPDGAMERGYHSHVDVLRAFDIPGIDVIWEQIRYPYGGRVPVPEGSVFFPRIAASAARQTGKNLALTETFGVFGDSITPDEMRYVANYQAIRGINVFNFMLMTSGRSRAGALVERPVFCAEKPGFFHLEHINCYFARLSYLTRVGRSEIDTALYYPANDFWVDTYKRQNAVLAYNESGKRLEEQNIAFDIIDDAGILEAEETAEGLKLGNAIYRHIVVPTCHFMPETVRRKIKPWIGEGTPILELKTAGLHLMSRNLEKGILYFVYNQEEKTAVEKLSFGKGMKVYRLELLTGDMYLEEDPVTVELLCGDMVVFLVTEEMYPAYPAACRETEYAVEVKEFLPVCCRKFQVTRDGISSIPVEGDVEALVTTDFSGEITYRGYYRLPSIPKAGERYRIVLEDTTVSVGIAIAGQKIATAGMSPVWAELPTEKLDQYGEIEITVANTAANEILAQKQVLHSLPAAELGPYYPKMYPIEAARPGLTLGKVWIEKRKQQ
ncbi:MAG: hypothetical protein IKC46_14130 [Lachnospiraceae bacterium]|nr:hypothetical protein [Lachnospiraceae bacterium]